MKKQIDEIKPDANYFLREVFLMKVIRRDDGKPSETFSTCREIVKGNIPCQKMGVFYQIKGSDLLAFLEKQEAAFKGK